MKRKKISLEELSFLLPLLDDAEQKMYVGGGDGSRWHPYTQKEYDMECSFRKWTGGWVIGSDSKIHYIEADTDIKSTPDGDGSKEHPYTANQFNDWHGYWAGGYVQGMGFVAPDSSITAHRYYENGIYHTEQYGSTDIKSTPDGDGSKEHPYTANQFNDWHGYWAGGYVQGMGFVAPDSSITAHRYYENGIYHTEQYGSYYDYNNWYYTGYTYYSDNEANRINNSGCSILENARRYAGTPYSFGGNSANGMDCSALITRACELNHRWTTSQPLPPDRFNIISVSTGRPGSFINDLQEGDILVWPGQHAAIYVGGSNIYHAHSTGVNQTGDLVSYWIRQKGYPVVYRSK